MDKPEERRVELANPDMPADAGLAGLGLIMQLGGTIYLGLMTTFTLTTIVASPSGSEGVGLLALIFAISVVRSAVHRLAGSAILYGPARSESSPGGPLGMTLIYIVASVVHTAIVLLVVNSQMHLPGSDLLAIAAILLAWPATLLIVINTNRIKQLAARIPMSEDRGFEGASIFMLLFGLAGAIFAACLALPMVRLPGAQLATFPGIGFLLISIMLLIRSIQHARAGSTGITSNDPYEIAAAVTRYSGWGLGSSIVAGCILVVAMLRFDAHAAGVLQAACVVFLLLSWPMIVRRFFGERGFSIYDDRTPEYHRAPDLGVTALGWLLLALGVVALAGALPGVLFGGNPALGESGMDMLSKDIATSFGRSQWWSVTISGVQIWAAVELITMSQRRKIAAFAYGGLSVVVTIYIALPLLESMNVFSDRIFGGNLGSAMVFGQVAISLVLPIGTMLLVKRDRGHAFRAHVVRQSDSADAKR